MAKRKKKHQKERVLEPLVKPGEPIKVPVKARGSERRHTRTNVLESRAKVRSFVSH